VRALKVPCGEGLSSYASPESCGCGREAVGGDAETGTRDAETGTRAFVAVKHREAPRDQNGELIPVFQNDQSFDALRYPHNRNVMDILIGDDGDPLPLPVGDPRLDFDLAQVSGAHNIPSE